jgi:hypothetical protein
MKGHDNTQYPLDEAVQFMDDHPGFSPVLSGDDAIICGFQVGECFLSIDEMHWLFATRPDTHVPSLILWSERTRRNRGQ